MSISNTVPVPTVPSKLRILAIVMHSGVAAPSDTTAEDGTITYGYTFTTPPYAEIVVQPCDLMLDGKGSLILNAFGMPVYNDVGNAKSFQITDPTKLIPFLSTWSTLIDAAEAEVAERITNGTL